MHGDLRNCHQAGLQYRSCRPTLKHSSSGQGLWSPWYMGNSMTDLDKRFGIDRIIDTPVAESACTGAAVGAALAGIKPIVVHPRNGLRSLRNGCARQSGGPSGRT